jgi:hypothetical protein
LNHVLVLHKYDQNCLFCSICQCILDILPAGLTLILQAVDPQAHAYGGLHRQQFQIGSHTVALLSLSDRSCKVSVYVGSAPARHEGRRGYGFTSHVALYISAPESNVRWSLCVGRHLVVSAAPTGTQCKCSPLLFLMHVVEWSRDP